MSKGLKQMVDSAMGTATPAPVQVSDEAVRALSVHMREWSGWANSVVRVGDPSKYGSPYACCDHNTRTFLVSTDRLVLNPNRVLITVTPFRLRQEAVLTGALLHEAGHARHSHWKPRNKAQVAGFRHHDGELPTHQTVALASLMEEPRIEGLMARDADNIGALGLGWTMRASAAQLLPTTSLSVDPDQKIMDLITSWALRAGRQIALNLRTGFRVRGWVQDFTTLLHGALVTHLSVVLDNGTEAITAKDVIDELLEMITCNDDRGSTMIDHARNILQTLFPETDPDDQPTAGGGCAVAGGGGDDEESEAGNDESTGEGDESGEQGTGNTEPEDEGSGDKPGAGDTGGDEAEQEGEAEGEPEAEQEGEAEGEPEAEQEEEAEPEQEEAETDTDSDLAQALADMERLAKTVEEGDAAEEAEADPSAPLDSGAGKGKTGRSNADWRTPTKDERSIAKGAERFLRDLIAPSEASKVALTDAPAATVDGAALAAWKAGGQSAAPRFFLHTRRNVEPSPPVKVAVLVDVSGSMEELQEPSAVLSWALASAALDLRNFAGRGQQIESCMIHWGNTARVIQHNNEVLPGIKEFVCFEGTDAMHEALRLVGEEMPGFFDATERPENRLLVQFTDWELSGYTRNASVPWIGSALEAGVNMLTITPKDYSERRSDLSDVLAQCKVQRGSSTLIRYNPMFPDQVWESAAKALSS